MTQCTKNRTVVKNAKAQNCDLLNGLPFEEYHTL
jgi:hypothetical protein